MDGDTRPLPAGSDNPTIRSDNDSVITDRKVIPPRKYLCQVYFYSNLSDPPEPGTLNSLFLVKAANSALRPDPIRFPILPAGNNPHPSIAPQKYMPVRVAFRALNPLRRTFSRPSTRSWSILRNLTLRDIQT